MRSTLDPFFSRALAAGTPAPPTVGTYGPAAWWDADASPLYDATSGGSLVTAEKGSVLRIEDLSGNGNHLARVTSGRYAKLATARIGGRDVLRLDGDKKTAFDCPGMTGVPLANFTAVFVGSTWMQNDYGGLVVLGSSAGGDDYQATTKGAISIARGVVNGIAADAYIGGVSNLLFVQGNGVGRAVWIFTSDGTSRRFFRNGVLMNSAAAISPATAAAGVGLFGRHLAGAWSTTEAHRWCGVFMEAAIFGSALSDVDAAAVSSILMDKWGITAAIPYTVPDLPGTIYAVRPSNAANVLGPGGAAPGAWDRVETLAADVGSDGVQLTSGNRPYYHNVSPGRGFAHFIGSTSEYMTSSSYAGILSHAGDFVVEMVVLVSALTATYQSLLAKWNSSTDYHIAINSTGKIYFDRHAGGSFRNYTTAASVTVGTAFALRISVDVDSGGQSTATFETAPYDEETGVIGTYSTFDTVNNAYAGNTTTGSQTLYIGRSQASNFPFKGRIYQLRFWSDLARTTKVYDLDFGTCMHGRQLCWPSVGGLNPSTFAALAGAVTPAGGVTILRASMLEYTGASQHLAVSPTVALTSSTWSSAAHLGTRGGGYAITAGGTGGAGNYGPFDVGATMFSDGNNNAQGTPSLGHGSYAISTTVAGANGRFLKAAAGAAFSIGTPSYTAAGGTTPLAYMGRRGTNYSIGLVGDWFHSTTVVSDEWDSLEWVTAAYLLHP